jgi:site-specific DNA-methyltransferase (adenine-specific)
LGFPTQKPLSLLERIIGASTRINGIVLDPFCGCGTAIHAAHKLNRRWIGIDITYLAINLIERRMKDAFPEIDFIVIGEPFDLASAHDMAKRDKWQFQWWALTKIDAQPVAGKKKGADKGIDGVIPFFAGPEEDFKRAIVSVKGGENIGVKDIRDLVGVLEREKAPVGVLFTLYPPTQPMITEAASAGFYKSEYWRKQVPKIQILTIEEYFKGKRPEILWEKSPFAKAKRENSNNNQIGIEIKD